MSKATPKEIKAEIKSVKEVMKTSKAIVNEFFKGERDAKDAKAAITAFAKSQSKIEKLMEKLEA